MPALPVGTNPRAGFLLGTAGALVIGAAAVAVTNHSHRAVEALLFVVPVVVAAIAGGRRAALAVAVIATITFSLVIPPIGSPQVHLVDDAIALAVFLTVAVLVGALVAGRVEVLTEIDNQRSLMLRSVSHDLRTPLASIRAAASEIALRSGSTPELADLIADEAERLDRLVANLLSLSRMEARSPRLDLQPVDLAELVDSVAHRQRRLVATSPLELALAEGLSMVRGDHALLERVVVNLLDNAVRHGGTGKPVRISTTSEDREVVLEVSDDGPGVPVEDRRAIFEAFRHGDHGRSTGIGLAICRAIVEAHAGTVSVGDAPGGGATFTVRLPAARPHPVGGG
ncbi:MAG: kdpD [Acidimicrobiales bacterium]|nr:kdpD [Acidimicrobiales bacterium]